jgi:two-component system CheB/CheR fusion protein
MGTGFEQTESTAAATTAAREQQTEAALHDALMRLRSVVETAADGIVTIDERGIIDSINPAAARLFGYDPSELIGRNVSILMPQPYAGEHDGYIAHYLGTGRAKIIGIGRDLIAKRRDGSLFPMRLAVSEMMIGGRRAFTGIISDLSERRQLERQVLEGAAAEQRRIGQDLHDGLCQQLGAMGFSLESLRRKFERGHQVDVAQFQKIQQLLNDSIGQLRQVAHGLQPVNFRIGGLPEALRALAESTSDRFKISCRARCSPAARVEDESTAEHLYRIAQEATGNAIKHGKAEAVRIHLAAPPVGGLSLLVLDNGRGFEPLPPAVAAMARPAGMGLRIMKFRAEAIGADLRIHPRRRGRGAAVWCALPPQRG